MELTETIIRKHAKILEAEVTVKAHVAHSKKGRSFNVKQHTRHLAQLRAKIAELKMELKKTDTQIVADAAKGGRDSSKGLPDHEFVANYRSEIEGKISNLRKQIAKAQKPGSSERYISKAKALAMFRGVHKKGMTSKEAAAAAAKAGPAPKPLFPGNQ